MSDITPQNIRDAEALVRADLRRLRHTHNTTGLPRECDYWTETIACWLIDDLQTALIAASEKRQKEAPK